MKGRSRKFAALRMPRPFAEMFATDAERRVATTLYPRLERLTFTRALPLQKDDRLFPSAYRGSILSDEIAGHSLGFDEEDLADDVLAVLKELGCEVSDSALADELQGAETVGQLVTAMASLISSSAVSTNC